MDHYEIGTAVWYHGSQEHHHNKIMMVIGTPEDGEMRGYMVIYGRRMPEYLYSVHHDSITPVNTSKK